MALGHLDELQKVEKYPIRWSFYTGFTVKCNYVAIPIWKQEHIGACNTRAGASTRFTSTSTSTCNIYEYEYKCEYLIITWVRVLVGEYEYRSVIYILYKQQYCGFQSLKMESSDCNKPGTKLQLQIVHVNCLCQFICLIILCNLVQLEQLECLHSEIPPSMAHDYPY